MFDKITKFGLPYLKKAGAILFLSALCVSFVFRFLFPEIYHHFDVTTFVEWGQFMNPLQNMYAGSCYCNYPVVGMLLSAGLIQLFDDQVFTFLIFLCFVDALNVILIWIIMKILKIPYALLWSGLIGLSFSSWIGGAQWGQIDNIGQFFLLIILLQTYFFLKYKNKDRTSINLNILWIGFFISLAFLTKQLLLFPLIPIVLFLVIYICASMNSTQRLTYLLSFIFAIVFPIFLFDLWLKIPDKYVFSHLERIFDTGSEHINFISGNGFNIWILFYSDQNTTSNGELLLGLSPKLIGLGLFAIGTFWLIYQTYSVIKKSLDRRQFSWLFLHVLGCFVFYNLLFNVVLTGTHERYLYHFYPYFLIFLLYAYVRMGSQLKYLKFDILVAFVGAGLYGLFVFCILMKYLDTLFFHRLLALFHLFLLIRLIYLVKTIEKKTDLLID